jgi:cardiolipin synthase
VPAPAATEPTSAPAPRGGNLTVPNVITSLRLLCLPVFVYLLFGRHNRAAAAWVLAAVGTTDFLDGFVARRWHQVSELGKVLDPAADRLVLIIGVGSIIIDGSAPGWFSAAVVVRELLVGGGVVILTMAGMERFAVRWVGKIGTCGLLMAFPLFLASHSTLGWHRGAGIWAWIVGIPGLACSWWAAVGYVPIARRALAEGRRRRRG